MARQLSSPNAHPEPLRTTSYSYDERGTLTSLVQQATGDPDGSQGFSATSMGPARTWTFINTYSAAHPSLLVRQAIDGPRSDVADVATYEWDELGNLTSVTDAL